MNVGDVVWEQMWQYHVIRGTGNFVNIVRVIVSQSRDVELIKTVIRCQTALVTIAMTTWQQTSTKTGLDDHRDRQRTRVVHNGSTNSHDWCSPAARHSHFSITTTSSTHNTSFINHNHNSAAAAATTTTICSERWQHYDTCVSDYNVTL